MTRGPEADFLFSQHSVADFEACPRRFYLRFVARQAWPLPEAAAPGLDAAGAEAYLRRGQVLHRWIERHLLGVPVDPGVGEGDTELQMWWRRFRSERLDDLPAERLPELALTAELGAERLYARFDLLAIGGGDAVIVDWKTLRGPRAPTEGFLRQRLQTRVYLYALAASGAPFNGGRPFEPGRIQMRYWLANFPERPWVKVAYSREAFEQDGRALAALIADIRSRSGEEAFGKTDDAKACARCGYRTLCSRQDARDPEAVLDDAPAEDDDRVVALEY